MRKLIYAPIIHLAADLGDIASEIDKKGKYSIGEDGWKRHKQAILKFWDSIDSYFDSMHVKNFKIYQDGLVADGEIGLRVVSNGVKKGSKNFEIVSKLVKKGAQLVKTESFPLVKKEYDFITKITKAERYFKKILAALNYKFHKNKLLRERDEFISQTIAKTLKEGETGILFLGANHEIISKLPKNIEVIELKEREKIKDYQKSFFSTKDKEKLNRLVKYLEAPIK